MKKATTIRARFVETDQMGVVHHSNYVIWCEAARVEWMRDQNLSYRELENDGISLAVSEFHITYRQAVLFDDAVDVFMEVTEFRSRRMAFAYEIRHSDGRLAAVATSVHIPTDTDGKAVRLPAKWFELFSQLSND